MICAGIDAGSRAVKAAIVETESGRLLAAGQAEQGIAQEAIAMDLLGEVLEGHGLKRRHVGRIVATGYARKMIRQADSTITEITCHARGVVEVCGRVGTIVEIGGQDSKIIQLDGGRSVRDFAMNDRCAAGTGRFLEMVAGRLAVGIEDLGELAGQSSSPVAISSMCAVFAETEIIGLLAEGARPGDIVAGVQAALAARVAALAGGNLTLPVIFTGGVAVVPGMVDALAAALGHEVTVAPQPQMTGAVGAALLAGA